MYSSLHSTITAQHPYPLLFATITGSHAFGIASPLSDFDVHGVHLLPLSEMLGLGIAHETVERKAMHDEEGQEVDIATHDLRKFVMLLLKGNGNVLEDIYSPLVVCSGDVHEELKQLSKGCITKQVANHYRGMAFNQQRRMLNNEVKKWLHTYRCLLMGIHLMRTGVLEMDLPTLISYYRQKQVWSLIDYKGQGFECMPDSDSVNHANILEALQHELNIAQQESTLPEAPTQKTIKELEQLLVKTRLA